jgi:hypothetical protein
MLTSSDYSALKFRAVYFAKNLPPLGPEAGAFPDHPDILLLEMEEYFDEE